MIEDGENVGARSAAETTVAIALSAVDHKRPEGADLLIRAEAFVITTGEQMEASADLLRNVKARIKALDTLRKSITGPIDDAKKRVMEAFRPDLDRLKAVEDKIKTAVLDWSEKQEQARRVEQARLDEIARKQRETLTTQAEEQREAGFHGQADVVESAAEEIRAPVAAPAAKPAGAAHIRSTWKAEVTDPKALAAAVGAGTCPANYIIANMTVLNVMARDQHEALEIPGVKAVEVKGVASR